MQARDGAQLYRPKLAALFATFNCSHLYLDVGSNIGVQIRKLFEPHKYLDAPVEKVFERSFGEPPRCNVCAIGMEPNPRHAGRLSELEAKLQRQGAPVAMLNMAAGTYNGETEFWMPSKPNKFNDCTLKY